MRSPLTKSRSLEAIVCHGFLHLIAASVDTQAAGHMPHSAVQYPARAARLQPHSRPLSLAKTHLKMGHARCPFHSIARPIVTSIETCFDEWEVTRNTGWIAELAGINRQLDKDCNRGASRQRASMATTIRSEMIVEFFIKSQISPREKVYKDMCKPKAKFID
jgi:hypothetical protein